MGDGKLVMSGEYTRIWYVLVVVCLELSSLCLLERKVATAHRICYKRAEMRTGRFPNARRDVECC